MIDFGEEGQHLKGGEKIFDFSGHSRMAGVASITLLSQTIEI